MRDLVRHPVGVTHVYPWTMSENKIDVTKPFIAIREDLEGSDYDATMGEYFCNPLDEDLLDVEVSTGGFYSDPEIASSPPMSRRTTC